MASLTYHISLGDGHRIEDSADVLIAHIGCSGTPQRKDSVVESAAAGLPSQCRECCVAADRLLCSCRVGKGIGDVIGRLVYASGRGWPAVMLRAESPKCEESKEILPMFAALKLLARYEFAKDVSKQKQVLTAPRASGVTQVAATEAPIGLLHRVEDNEADKADLHTYRTKCCRTPQMDLL